MKYFCKADEKFYSPIKKRSCFNVDAPFTYVMPSNIDYATAVLGTVPLIGCVVID